MPVLGTTRSIDAVREALGQESKDVKNRAKSLVELVARMTKLGRPKGGAAGARSAAPRRRGRTVRSTS